MKITVKKFKRVFSLLLSLALIFSPTVYTKASEGTNIHSTKNNPKLQLMEKHRTEKKNYTENEIKTRDEQVDQDIAFLINSGKSQDEIDSILESKYNIYRLKTSDSINGQVTTFSEGSSDVTLNEVTVYYDAEVSQWILSASGYWNNDNWLDDAGVNAYLKYESNVGGVDSMAIVLYDVNGQYGSTIFKGASGWIGDQRQIIKQDYKNTYSNNYKNLVAIKFQDYTHAYSDFDISYVGAAFGITGRYSSSFANYHGKVALNYIHTWNNTSISSVTFEASKAPNLQITWVSEGDDWEIYGPEAAF